MSEGAAGARRTFAPVVVLGLAGGAVAAVAGNRVWVSWAAAGQGDYSVLRLTGQSSATVPLAGALALVVLACWGVVLVTRGRSRRIVAALGLVVALGMVITALLGLPAATRGLRGELRRVGVQDVTTSTTTWFWAYLAAAVVVLAACVAAVRWVPAWPEMGQRYDAPGSQHPESGPDPTDLDIWKALDEGRDPTLPDRSQVDP